MSGFHRELRFRAQLLPRFTLGPRLLRALRWANGRMPLFSGAPDVDARIASVGGVRACVFRPRGRTEALPVLVWFHGGGFVVGTPVQDAPACARLARDLGIAVVAPFYRLAPEHPFPAALDDAWALLSAIGEVGARADRIAIGGMSAGGGLAAQLALRVRDREGPKPVLQLLVYPMLDDRTVLRTDVDETHLRLWGVESNRFGWRSYLGAEPGGSDTPAGAVPARAASLAGLPPAWIGVGTHDLFHDEDVAYARRLEAAGVPCALEVIEGAYHGFDAVSPGAPVTRRFRESREAVLREALVG